MEDGAVRHREHEIDLLRAELVEVKQERDYWIGSTERAAARLAAIVDLCDQRPHGTTRTLLAQIRSAATEDIP